MQYNEGSDIPLTKISFQEQFDFHIPEAIGTLMCFTSLPNYDP